MLLIAPERQVSSAVPAIVPPLIAALDTRPVLSTVILTSTRLGSSPLRAFSSPKQVLTPLLLRIIVSSTVVFNEAFFSVVAVAAGAVEAVVLGVEAVIAIVGTGIKLEIQDLK